MNKLEKHNKFSSKVKGGVVNSLLLLSSILTGIIISNQFFIFWYKNFDQRSGFSRPLLRSLLPLARWSYPDIYKNKTDKRILIVGDSYAEGAGDAF